MTRAEWFAPKWKWGRRFALSGLLGIPLLVAGAVTKSTPIGMLGGLPFVPLLVWLSLVPILHWKDRYVGRRPIIWVAFMVLETTGWTRLLYWFVHVLPDSRSEGPDGDRP